MKDIEYELRKLEVSEKKATSKLKLLGAQKVGTYLYKRYVFDTIPPKKGRWIRLRTDGKLTTLTVKQIRDDTVDGTTEYEIKVSDFDVALSMLLLMGYKPKGYQENRRTEYSLDGVHVCIDTWPKIPPYLEIEGNSKQAVLKCAKKLGYSEKDLIGLNTEKIYLKYGIDIRKNANLRF